MHLEQVCALFGPRCLVVGNVLEYGELVPAECGLPRRFCVYLFQLPGRESLFDWQSLLSTKFNLSLYNRAINRCPDLGHTSEISCKNKDHEIEVDIANCLALMSSYNCSKNDGPLQDEGKLPIPLRYQLPSRLVSKVPVIHSTVHRTPLDAVMGKVSICFMLAQTRITHVVDVT